MEGVAAPLRVGAPKTPKRLYVAAFLLAALTAAVFMLPFLLKEGVFYIGSDFVHQQVPFWSYANGAVKAGDVLWTDRLDLGSQFIGGFSFYTIGSPFFWITLLVPGWMFYHISLFVLALKIGVAGLSAFCWLKRYTQKDETALLCSLLYAFCGFQISNLNFNHFADVVALFPFVLWALDGLVLDGKRGRFALALGLCALCNWFCFFGVALFLVLYYLVRLWSKTYPLPTLRGFGRLCAEAAMGVGLSAVIVLPSVLFMMSNPRTAMGFESVWQMLVPKPIVLAELVRGMLMPAECSASRGFFLPALFNGGELYLPLFGLVPAAAFVLTKRKSFEAKMALVCLVFMLVPVLNSAFVAFNAEYYTRWFFMPTLILCLATARALEDRQLPLKRGILFYVGLWGLFFLMFLWFTYYFKVPFVYNLAPAAVYVLLSVSGFGITLFVRRIQALKRGFALLLALVVAYAGATVFYNILRQQKYWEESDVKALYQAPGKLELEPEETYYRVDTSGAVFFNLGTMAGFAGTTAFSSTVSGSIFAFYDMMEEPRSVISAIAPDKYGYQALWSVKYGAVYEVPQDADGAPVQTAGTGAQGALAIRENGYYIPLGFAFDNYMTVQQLQAVDKDRRHLALVRALVLDEQQAARYADVLRPLEDSALQTLNHAGFESDVKARCATSAYASAKDGAGYHLWVEMQRENLLFLSVPWDAGWQCEVNGESVDIERVDGGFMAVLCPAGACEVVLRYSPPGGAAGLGISLAAVLVLALYVLWPRLRGLRKRGMKTDV